MKKYLLPNQPPLTRKFTFLVDDITEKSNWGRAVEMSKVEYNFKLLGNAFSIDTEIYTALSKKGATTVIPIGRFITVIEIRKDEQQARMTFFDFDFLIEKVKFRQILLEDFSENIVSEWFKFQSLLKNEFSEADDIVILSKPNEL